MDANDARSIMNNSKAMQYIIRAAMEGKSNVDIPKDYVDRNYLSNLGYKVTGGDHQLHEFCNISWEKHWRDYNLIYYIVMEKYFLENLIKDYLEQSNNNKVEILSLTCDDNFCIVKYKSVQFDDNCETTELINIWDVLSFIYSKIK